MAHRLSRLPIAVGVVTAGFLLASCNANVSALRAAPASPSPSADRASAPASPSAPPTTAAPTSPVHVSLLESDGSQYGVGMPIIAYFDVAPTNATAFNAATKVTVNGQRVQGNWYFEPPTRAGAAMEAHWRPQTYWPAHAAIHMQLPVKGLSAGTGLSFNDNLTLSITTGPANISTVDAVTHQMTVTSDGRLVGTYPVSLGAANTPTARGIKVIMEKGLDISMSGPGYYDPHVQFTQRLTYGGEYLHSAPWNVANIGVHSTSNGCTNLLPSDAQALYNMFEVGDVVNYPNANGPPMTLGAGYGDWNVSWAQWQTGGALPVTG